jgi:hypothetical protein
MEREIRKTEEELTGQQRCVDGGEVRGAASEFSLSSHLSPLVAHQKRLREQHNRQRRLCHVLYKTLTFGLIEHHTDGLVLTDRVGPHRLSKMLPCTGEQTGFVHFRMVSV